MYAEHVVGESWLGLECPDWIRMHIKSIMKVSDLYQDVTRVQRLYLIFNI